MRHHPVGHQASPAAPRRPAPKPRPERGGSWEADLEQLLTLAAAVVVAAATCVWAGAQLAARLHTQAWLPADPVDALTAVFLLVADPGDPAGAWPAGTARLLPGPLGYWTATALVPLVALVALAATCVWLRRRRPDGQDDAGAHWARRRELRLLRVAQPTQGRLTIGRPLAGRGLLAAEVGQSVAVIGPTQSGKTTGLVIPAILEWDGPVVATSVKTDLLHDTLSWRQKRGHVWVYDPAMTTGLPGATWSPLPACHDWQGALKIASWMSRTVKQTGGAGLTDGDFWYASAAKLLAPMLFAASRAGLAISEVVLWLDLHEEAEPHAILLDAGVPEALAAAHASYKRESRQKSSVYTTAETVLAAYADPKVAASARGCDIDPQRLLDGGAHTLYICAPVEEQDRLRPLFVSLLQTVIAAAHERAHRTGQPLDPRLLVVLDEAANIATLPDLDKLASTAAGHGIQLVTVWQDLAQMRDRYRERAFTLVNNHRATILLRGIKDPATLDYASRLVGEARVPHISTSTAADGRRSVTQATHGQRLAPDHVLRVLPQGQALLVYGALPAAKVRLRPWYRDRHLTARARGAPPTPPRRLSPAFPANGESADGPV